MLARSRSLGPEARTRHRGQGYDPSLTFRTAEGRHLWQSAYPTHRACVDTLRDLIELLGVTSYRLAAMLGLPETTTIYKWNAGTMRPSPIYLIRMMKLLLLHARGELDVETFDGALAWSGGGEAMEAKMRSVAS